MPLRVIVVPASYWEKCYRMKVVIMGCKCTAQGLEVTDSETGHFFSFLKIVVDKEGIQRP